MIKNSKITDSEWKVMEIVWNNGQLKASHIIAELQTEAKWSDNTIRTLINRLVEKHILGIKKEKVNEYYSLVSQDECIKNETNKFVDKIYKGSVGLLISNFVKENKLSNEDLAMIKEMIKDEENSKN